MRFTLVYQGDLPPKGNTDIQWRIRRALEPQMRLLWEQPPISDHSKYTDPSYEPSDCYVGRRLGNGEDGIEYVPLISSKLDLRAKLRVRLLSSSLPGGIYRSGDIDNRIKTLLDALSMPQSKQQVPKSAETEDDNRVFCLLEDDRLVTALEVSNDRLLTVAKSSPQTMAIVDVHPIAFRVTFANLGISL